MILKIGHLTQSAEARSTRLERSVPGMIRSVIFVALVPLYDFIDVMTLSVIACESRQGKPSKLPTMRSDIICMCNNINYLNFVEFSDLIRIVYDGDALKTSDILPATTGDVQMGYEVVTDADSETDEELVTAQTKGDERSLGRAQHL